LGLQFAFTQTGRLFFAFVFADILSPWNPWAWDFLLVLRRPIETAALTGAIK
jgi:hypothetical protein